MNLDETSNLLSQKIENLSVEIERIKSSKSCMTLYKMYNNYYNE